MFPGARMHKPSLTEINAAIADLSNQAEIIIGSTGGSISALPGDPKQVIGDTVHALVQKHADAHDRFNRINFLKSRLNEESEPERNPVFEDMAEGFIQNIVEKARKNLETELSEAGKAVFETDQKLPGRLRSHL